VVRRLIIRIFGFQVELSQYLVCGPKLEYGSVPQSNQFTLCPGPDRTVVNDIVMSSFFKSVVTTAGNGKRLRSICWCQVLNLTSCMYGWTIVERMMQQIDHLCSQPGRVTESFRARIPV
jgi:hypothetical protein